MLRARLTLSLSSGLIAAGLGAGAAQATLSPEAYVAARSQAAHHLQLRIVEVLPPPAGSGPCLVSADVVHSFKGALAEGTRVQIPVSCYRFGPYPSGDTMWTDYDALSRAQYLEAFLTAGPQMSPARDQVEIILAPRETPYCSTSSLDCVSALVGDHLPERSCSFVDQLFVLFGLFGEACRPTEHAGGTSRPALRQP